jgi:microcystin-dependent protein
MEFIMGGIIMFGGNFAPRSWASCEGQLLAISQNQALYAILGTTWGGDGRTTFAVPDLRSRAPVGIGRGPGLSPINLGRMVGTETTQMTIAQMPAHTHTAVFTPSGGGSGSLTATATVNASNGKGNENDAGGNYWATAAAGVAKAASSFSSTTDTTMAADAVTVSLSGSTGGITGGTVANGATGGSQKLNNIQPSLGMRYLICTQGAFPSRN